MLEEKERKERKKKIPSFISAFARNNRQASKEAVKRPCGKKAEKVCIKKQKMQGSDDERGNTRKRRKNERDKQNKNMER